MTKTVFNHPYRTHTCHDLREGDEGKKVTLSGWVHRIRDHGLLIFIDLRDHYGMTQCVIEKSAKAFEVVESLRHESVITVIGKVLKRTPETVNETLATGRIEVVVDDVRVENACQPLPMQVNSDQEFPEDTRLTYRFLDLRREKMHQNILLRSQIIAHLRQKMHDLGFLDIQTPILTASSPEGARDYVVPSRLHPGMFYALPQAPQQFKQMLMVGGFDKYFQIAPCFRDEDARADRSPGEFYQLDMEMAFVTQEDVFQVLEKVLTDTFETFGGNYKVTKGSYPRIPYQKAMMTYGCDKPDLRNPLVWVDVNKAFQDGGFPVFEKIIQQGGLVRGCCVPSVAQQPRSFFDKINKWAMAEGAPGLGYVIRGDQGSKGPIGKFLTQEQLEALWTLTQAQEGDGVFFVAGDPHDTHDFCHRVRKKLGEDLDLLEKECFKFCWITDFPMFEKNKETGTIDFSHNPFSMPQGGLNALETRDPLDIKAFQYDIVCNGIELSSGAIRNHNVETLFKAFEIAGYDRASVMREFGGMVRAFQYGAPPHGGCAPGIDRIVMLLAKEPNLREVVAFPMNQKAQDLLMGAPNRVAKSHLKELHIDTIEEEMPLAEAPER